LPLEIRPAKGGVTTLYLRIPQDVMKMYNITRATPFTFELVEGRDGVRLVYRLQVAARNKKRKGYDV